MGHHERNNIRLEERSKDMEEAHAERIITKKNHRLGTLNHRFNLNNIM